MLPRTRIPLVSPLAVLAVVLVALATLTGARASASAAATSTEVAPTPKCLATEITPGVQPRAEYVWRRLRAAGYSPAAAAGILGNLDHRSALTPTAQSEDGTYVGLALWGATRWTRLVDYAQDNGAHRWSLATQTSFLLRELLADRGTFRHRSYARSTDPQAAAVKFQRAFFNSPVADEAVRLTRGARATQWASLLAAVPGDADPRDNNTYGLLLGCEPIPGTLDRCPMVPRSFQEYFRRATGFVWNRMSEESKMVSRCVYTNFPRIKIHGTYRPGHLPTWGRAIDFMMPHGCTTGADRSWTNKGADVVLGGRLAQYLLHHATRLRVDYVIWQDRIRNPGWERDENDFAPITVWRQDPYNNGNCTNTHYDHVHMSVLGPLAAAASVPRGDAAGTIGR